MSGTKTIIFASALMLSAIRAEDAVKNSLNRLSRLSHEPISPNRRFNLEAVVNESTENQI